MTLPRHGLPPPWSPVEAQVKAIVGLLEEPARAAGRTLREAFDAWLTLFACSLAAPCSPPQSARELETTYLREADRWDREQLHVFTQAAGTVVGYFGHAIDKGQPFEDILGRLLMSREMNWKGAGQFFTPMHVARMMARINFPDGPALEAEFAAKDRILTIAEPACGGGVMVLAVVNVLREHGYPYASHAWIHATDVDVRCARMTYIQLSLAGAAATVTHGNTLAAESWAEWDTLACGLNRVQARLARQRQEERGDDE